MNWLRKTGRARPTWSVSRKTIEEQILTSSDKTRGDRGYHQTLEAIKPLLAAMDSWRFRSIAVE